MNHSTMQQPPQPVAIVALPGAGGGQPHSSHLNLWCSSPHQSLQHLALTEPSMLIQPQADPYHSNYHEALAYFWLIARVNPKPQVAANWVYNAGSWEPIALIMHCWDAVAAADDTGVIKVYYCISLYSPQMGWVTQWDNQAFAFFGDLVVQMVQSVIICVGTCSTRWMNSAFQTWLLPMLHLLQTWH